MKTIFSGNWLGTEAITKRLPSIIYIIALTVLYIFNIFSTQRIYRTITRAEREILSLTVTANTSRTNLVSLTKESKIVEEIEKRQIPLIEIKTPPPTFKPMD
ncbi:MAG: FtsL-like putative cell division protein [Rikenellaceae bacterium]